MLLHIHSPQTETVIDLEKMPPIISSYNKSQVMFFHIFSKIISIFRYLFKSFGYRNVSVDFVPYKFCKGFYSFILIIWFIGYGKFIKVIVSGTLFA